jgi:hypothetical protein
MYVHNESSNAIAPHIFVRFPIQIIDNAFEYSISHAATGRWLKKRQVVKAVVIVVNDDRIGLPWDDSSATTPRLSWANARLIKQPKPL